MLAIGRLVASLFQKISSFFEMGRGRDVALGGGRGLQVQEAATV